MFVNIIVIVLCVIAVLLFYWSFRVSTLGQEGGARESRDAAGTGWMLLIIASVVWIFTH